MKDLTTAFVELDLNSEGYDLLLPLIQQVLDAAATLKDDKDLEHRHRLHQFQQVVMEITQRLQNPHMMADLKEESETKDFWATVDLRSLVQRRVMKEAMDK